MPIHLKSGVFFLLFVPAVDAFGQSHPCYWVAFIAKVMITTRARAGCGIEWFAADRTLDHHTLFPFSGQNQLANSGDLLNSSLRATMPMA
jgi:hypothetical protein